MVAQPKKSASVRRLNDDPHADPDALQDYCARLTCRKPFTRTIGRGRPQAFCSDICRRSAEKELRQAKARLAHFEGVVDQLRSDIAGYNRGHMEPAETASSDAQRRAETATARVRGILEFADHLDDNPFARELRDFYDAVAPVIGRSEAS